MFGSMLWAAASAFTYLTGNMSLFCQFAGIGQARQYHHEQLHWIRRGYRKDAQALRLDVVNALKEDIRDLYTTYVGRIDTLLLVQTILFTFSLGTLQFSGKFMPSTTADCDHCIEVAHISLYFGWVILVAILLIASFWSVVMTIWCKLKLDGWLERALAKINRELRATLDHRAFDFDADKEEQARLQNPQQLIELVSSYSRGFSKVWGNECAGMLQLSLCLFWFSTFLAVFLTSGTFCGFLHNSRGDLRSEAIQYIVQILVGLCAPVAYLVIYMVRAQYKPNDDQQNEQDISVDDLGRTIGSEGVSSNAFPQPSSSGGLRGNPFPIYEESSAPPSFSSDPGPRPHSAHVPGNASDNDEVRRIATAPSLGRNN